MKYCWCLDNGHGKLTHGKRSPLFEDGATRFLEYEFNRDIVRRIIEQLETLGISYFNVVPEINIDDFLAGRVNRANTHRSDQPKIYLSIHSNASPAKDMNTWGSDSAKGIETWYHAASSKGRRLAEVFQKHLTQETGMKDRGLRNTDQTNLYVLRKTNMTSVLTETGFYNNRIEVKDLMRDDFRQKIAIAHINAIIEVERNGL